MFRHITLLLFITSLLAFEGWTATYYSQGSVAPNTLANWKSTRDGLGSPTTPGNFTSGDVFVIQNGHNMTTSNTWTISGTNSKLWIEDGGTLTIGHTVTLAAATTFQMDNGSNCVVNIAVNLGSTLFQGTESFSSGSTIELKANPSGTSAPGGSGYGNLIINVGSAAASFGWGGNLTAVQGNLTVKATGGGSFRHALVASAGNKSVTVGGNLAVEGGLFYFSSGSSTVDMAVTGNVLLSGGTLDLANSTGAGTLNIGGNLTISGGTLLANSTVSTINFNGASSQFTFSSGTLTNTRINWAVNTSKSLTLNNNLPIATSRTLTVNGTLDCGTDTVTGAGAFSLASGATLKIGSPDGISNVPSTGNIQVTGTRTYNFGGIYEYSGVSAQVTGPSLPTNISGTLKINNSSGVTLSQSTTATTVDMTLGNLDLGSNNLTLTSLSITSPSATKMIIASGGGELRKVFTAPDIFTFPVGDNSGTVEYSPVTLLINSGTFSSAYVGVKVKNTSHPEKGPGTLFLNRYWTLTPSGITSPNYDVEFYYVDADVSEPANEANLKLGKFSAGTGWSQPASTVNTTSNFLTASGLTSFSDFTGGEPTALPVELTSFTASAKGSTVTLNWETKTEVDNNGFEVERNVSGNWDKIGFVEGHGTANSPKYYSFVDNGAIGNKIQYRLKQIDNDGTFEYSPEVEVELNPTTFALYQNYPNPFNPSTIIRFSMPVNGNVVLNVFNTLGEKVASLLNGQMEAGYHEVSFDAKNLPSGLYFYEIKAGDFSSIKKMILIK
ncbi:MAG: T9SS type A sorting domain-containing protein [Bacteroidetes bacterium]|nr:T9SS type A sorting domain-containing protein [Bacteroidota bacterium]